MIQFPSDRADYGQQHVAGSQDDANDKCAQNMREGAIQFRAGKTKGPTTARQVRRSDGMDAVTFVALIVMGAAIAAAWMMR